jgi:hypothetical protein
VRAVTHEAADRDAGHGWVGRDLPAAGPHGGREERQPAVGRLPAGAGGTIAGLAGHDRQQLGGEIGVDRPGGGQHRQAVSGILAGQALDGPLGHVLEHASAGPGSVPPRLAHRLAAQDGQVL